jgi:hypothetical protein
MKWGRYASGHRSLTVQERSRPEITDPDDPGFDGSLDQLPDGCRSIDFYEKWPSDGRHRN